MKLHRFFSPTKIDDGVSSMGGQSTTFTDVSQQWQKVLRLSRGEQVALFDGSGYDFLCEIKDYQGDTVVLTILEKKENRVTAVRDVVLYAALVKKDTFEWVVQKATELGVSDIVPVIAERSEKKNINTERLQKIITEASEQSGRGVLPGLRDIASLVDAVEAAKVRDGKVTQMIAFDPTGIKMSEQEIKNTPDQVGIFIGPEGGWSMKELDYFRKSGVAVYSLGSQILRTETAVVAALSKIVF